MQRRSMQRRHLPWSTPATAHGCMADPTRPTRRTPSLTGPHLQHARLHMAAFVRPCCPRSRRCCWPRILTSRPSAITTPPRSTRATRARSHAVIESRDMVSHDRHSDAPTPSTSTPSPTTRNRTQSCCNGRKPSNPTRPQRRIRSCAVARASCTRSSASMPS